MQSKDKVNISAGMGIALREINAVPGSADYMLLVNSKAVGVIEAKKETEGHRLSMVEDQAVRYAKDGIKIGEFKQENE